MALGGMLTLNAKRLSKTQLLSALDLGALFVHQYEEYVDPGWFPGPFNHGVLKSDQPRNYPLNQSTISLAARAMRAGWPAKGSPSSSAAARTTCASDGRAYGWAE
jgi:hypothetical protein